jgi:hypothetical protein
VLAQSIKENVLQARLWTATATTQMYAAEQFAERPIPFHGDASFQQKLWIYADRRLLTPAVHAVQSGLHRNCSGEGMATMVAKNDEFRDRGDSE